MSYTSAVSHGKSARKVEKRRTELLRQMKESEKNVRKMKTFKNDAKLRDSVASYFRICQLVLNEDYGKLLNLEDIAEQSYDAMEAYLLAKERANEKLDDANQKVSDQYDAFAANNNIKLVESDSKLSQKIKEATKVHAYYNVVYLIFFKSYKNEAYFMEAMNKADVNAMEQSRNSLLTSSTDDLTKLGPIAAYQGDASLKSSCQQLLNFYKKEASVHFPVFVEYQLKKENFEKMQKVIEGKQNRTQAEVDAFNKAVKEFNDFTKKANASNNECNKNRSSFLNKWNESVETFLDSHTPKYR